MIGDLSGFVKGLAVLMSSKKTCSSKCFRNSSIAALSVYSAGLTVDGGTPSELMFVDFSSEVQLEIKRY